MLTSISSLYLDKGQYTQFLKKKIEKQLTNRYVSFGQLINFPCDGRLEVLFLMPKTIFIGGLQIAF